MKVSDTNFIATPVQNHLPLSLDKLPSVQLFKTFKSWKYTFDNSREWLSDDMVDQMLIKLDRKLDEHKNAGQS